MNTIQWTITIYVPAVFFIQNDSLYSISNDTFYVWSLDERGKGRNDGWDCRLPDFRRRGEDSGFKISKEIRSVKRTFWVKKLLTQLQKIIIKTQRKAAIHRRNYTHLTLFRALSKNVSYVTIQLKNTFPQKVCLKLRI